MTRPRIATITPTIPPRARMLRRALTSIQAQTLPADYVCVAVDNDREGAPPTRQRALNMVPLDAAWVAPLDDDDEFLPQHLEHLLRHAEETGADYVYAWFELIGQAGQSYGTVDPIFPKGHYKNPFDPNEPIETTITVLVRAELARQVGYQALERGGQDVANSGEDYNFLLNCLKLGAKVSHLVERTWLWRHHGRGAPGVPGNTSGLPTRW